MPPWHYAYGKHSTGKLKPPKSPPVILPPLTIGVCAHIISALYSLFQMNITLSVDEQVAQRAREAAQKMGKSLNQVVRDYLEQLAGGALRGQQWSQFEERCLNSGAKLDGWKFDRDEANER